MMEHLHMPSAPQPKDQIMVNRIVGFIVISAALAFAVVVAEMFGLMHAAQKGERHTYEQAVRDCERVNDLARALNQPVWNCGDIYSDY